MLQVVYSRNQSGTNLSGKYICIQDLRDVYLGQNWAAPLFSHPKYSKTCELFITYNISFHHKRIKSGLIAKGSNQYLDTVNYLVDSVPQQNFLASFCEAL